MSISRYDSRLTLDGSGPLLVYVPGMDGTGDLFYRQIPNLARRHTVATYALRDEADSMDILVGDLAEIVEKTLDDGQPAIIVGESFGGALSMSLALAEPDLVSALVILNSFPRFLPQSRLRAVALALRILPWEGMPIVRRVTASRMHSKHTHRAEIKRFLEITSKTTRRGYLHRLEILREYDVRDRLSEIRAPTLFLAAEEDHLVPAIEQASYMAERVPSATLKTLPGHGHNCFLAPNLDLDLILREWRPL